MFDGFSIMTSFFAELVHTDNSKQCSDVEGFMDLSTAQECSSVLVVDYARTFKSNARYQWETFDLSYPMGCIIIDNFANVFDGGMFFNTHPTGARHSNYRNICRKGNT